MQIPWRKRAAIQVLSSLGLIAGILMMVRIPHIRTLDLTEDFLYEAV
ncbi:hypothetical protein FOFC_13731 [Fusarium oxysporum]|nr:hypothetical protein FOFC_13731 [Fusarium oxysporum]